MEGKTETKTDPVSGNGRTDNPDRRESRAETSEQPRRGGLIEKTIRIIGELHGEEDLVIEGKVQGTIKLKKHLTIEKTGVVDADVSVEDITIRGQMKGNTSAANKVQVASDAVVVGDIKAPRVVIEDGAVIKGNVVMDVDLPKDLAN